MMNICWEWPLRPICVILLLVYMAFQLHLLPKKLSKIVSKVFFYPTLPLTYWTRRHAYWTQLDGKVIFGVALLEPLQHVEMLHSKGVRAVVNLCDEYSGPLRKYDKLAIVQLYLPTIVRTDLLLH